MKNSAYYFSHDSNAQDDPKCLLLIDQLGMEGYGIFWALIEKLRQEDTYTLPISVVTIYARYWNTSAEKIKTVINNYNLFVVENNMFFSLRLKQSMEMMKNKASLAAQKRWESKKHPTLELKNDTHNELEKEESPVVDVNKAIEDMQAHEPSNAQDMQAHEPSNAQPMLKDAKEKKRKEKKLNEKNKLYLEFDKSNYTQQQIESFEKFNQWIDAEIPELREIEKQLTIDQFLEYKIKIDTIPSYYAKFVEKLESLANRPNLSKNYISVHLTIKKWMKND
jgi:hypothetical protein